MTKKYVGAILPVKDNGEYKHLIEVRSEKEDYEPGAWSVPGGEVEENEDPDDAVLREVEEELNISLEKDKLYSVHRKKKDSEEGYGFAYPLDEEDLKTITLGEEIKSVRMLPEEEVYRNLDRMERMTKIYYSILKEKGCSLDQLFEP
ncbi:MAG: NUDIX domain-containing protein [Candidatus Aenigmatarchaeota archaeon]